MSSIFRLCTLQTLLLLFGGSTAYPSSHQFNQVGSQPYVAPGPDDSRAPCPTLNSLANHGYINHDGRDIERQDIIDAFHTHLNIEESAIDLALTNAFVVCEYVTGSSCGTTLKNLTLLAEPHAFEHDHSFSREDYMMAYLAEDEPFSDNQNFNSSIFQTSVDVVDGSSHLDYVQMNQVRLQRESLALQNDKPGWFLESKPIQEFEAGFIFAIMGDFNLPQYSTHPKVRMDWWKYWFTNESFPYELGWHPPPVPRGSDFVLSASSRILAAEATATPTPLPSNAIGSAPLAGTLFEGSRTTTYQVPTFTPYAAPGVGPNDKRDIVSTYELTKASVSFKNPYVQKLAASDIADKQAYASSRMAAFEEAKALSKAG